MAWSWPCIPERRASASVGGDNLIRWIAFFGEMQKTSSRNPQSKTRHGRDVSLRQLAADAGLGQNHRKLRKVINEYILQKRGQDETSTQT